MAKIATAFNRTAVMTILFYFFLFGIGVFKLYLIAGQEVIAEPYDTYQYLWMADAWYWGTKYSSFRLPGFPLFVATMFNTGMPLRLIFELLFLAAAARLATAHVGLGFPRWSAVLVFIFTVMLPYTFVWFNFAYVESMLSSVLLWGTAEFSYLLVTRGGRFWAHNLVFSFLVALAWFSRPETVLLLGAAIAAASILVLGAVFLKQGLRPVLLTCLRLFGPAAALVFVAGIAISSLNYKHFGRFSAVEDQRAPAFVRAYDDLQDIGSDKVIRYVPVTLDQMEQAAAISPAFAEIFPAFKGPIGDFYRRISKNDAGVDGEIAGGWLIWAIREAVDGAGYQDSRAQDAFYQRLAREIEMASAAGKIELIRFPLPLVDPHWKAWAPFLPNSLVATASRLIPYWPLTSPRQDVVAPEITREFDRSANRRAALVIPGDPDRRVERVDKALAWLGKIYAPMMLALSGLAVVLFALGGWKRLSLPLGALMALIAVLVVGRISLMALIDASSFPNVTNDRYLMPASVLVPVFIINILTLMFCGKPKTDDEKLRIPVDAARHDEIAPAIRGVQSGNCWTI